MTTIQQPNNENIQIPRTPEEIESLLNELRSHRPDMDAATNNHIRAAIYTRKSRIEPDKVHYSMEIQPDRAEAYACSQGWEIVNLYADPNKTGRNSKRKELQRLIRDIKSGKIDVIVIHRLDRLYRNLIALLKFIQLINQYNVRLVSVTEQIDTESPWGRLVVYVLGSLAEMLVLQTSLRTRESKAARVRKGLPNGTLPLGYCNGLCSQCADPNGEGYCPEYDHPNRGDGRISVWHPVDHHAIRLIHHLYRQGLSQREIACYLNTHRFELPDGTIVQFRTQGIRGLMEPDNFKRDSIREIVRNPFYIGLVARYPTAPLDMNDDPDIPQPDKRQTKPYVPNKRQPLELQPGQHQPIISSSLWQHNQHLRKAKARTPHSNARSKRIYILTGVAKCWECWQAEGKLVGLRGSTGGRQGHLTYYRCAAIHDQYRKQRNTTGQISPGIGLQAYENPGWDLLVKRHRNLRADVLIPQVENLINHFTIPADWYEEILASYLNDDGMSAFERESYNLHQELLRLRNLYSLGYITLADFQVRGTGIQQQLKQLQPSTRSEASEILPLLEDFSTLWEKLDAGEKRLMLGTIFANFFFDGQGKLRWVQAHAPFDRLLGLPEGGAMFEQ